MVFDDVVAVGERCSDGLARGAKIVAGQGLLRQRSVLGRALAPIGTGC